ncbi:hypothetical protein SEETLT21_19286 [Salmonella enterica subsp. enterica serovar Typhimurium str. LT2-4_delta.ramA::kan]|nr:hypothetical protein SEETLT21_19286 [Salmonella enterica subsp. enterica serovar Typhimurium str. LT2-4_delta.ramA::kan]
MAIDYPAALALRQMAMQHDDYPKLSAGTGGKCPAPLRP